MNGTIERPGETNARERPTLLSSISCERGSRMYIVLRKIHKLIFVSHNSHQNFDICKKHSRTEINLFLLC